MNTADVIDDTPFGRDWDADSASIIVAALLAYGGGDPVVIMPDGTLRRLVDAGLKESVDPPHVPLGVNEVACCEGRWRPAHLYRLTDPEETDDA